MNDLQQRVAPPPVDPLAVELGLVPPPQQPLPGSGVPQPGQPQSPQLDPSLQPPAQPGQPQNPGQDPGQRSDLELVQEYIASESRRQAEEAITPYIQRQEATRRREDGEGLLEDYPELRSPEVAQALMSQARQYAQGLGVPQLAGEPGFVEMVHLVRRAIDAAGQSATPAVPGVQPQPGVPAAPGVPQQPGAVTLETPGGTAPPAPVNDETVQRIKAAGRRGALSPLWGGTAHAAAPAPAPAYPPAPGVPVA